jgi:hypothetical protein
LARTAGPTYVWSIGAAGTVVCSGRSMRPID